MISSAKNYVPVIVNTEKGHRMSANNSASVRVIIVVSDGSKQTTKTTHRTGLENTTGETAKPTRAQTANLMEERMRNWNGF